MSPYAFHQYERLFSAVNALGAFPGKCNNVCEECPMSFADSVRAQLPDAAPTSPFYTEEREAFRHTVRRFVERVIMKDLAARQMGL